MCRDKAEINFWSFLSRILEINERATEEFLMFNLNYKDSNFPFNINSRNTYDNRNKASTNSRLPIGNR